MTIYPIEIFIKNEDQVIKVSADQYKECAVAIQDCLSGKQQSYQMPSEVLGAVLFLMINGSDTNNDINGKLHEIIGDTFANTPQDLLPFP